MKFHSTQRLSLVALWISLCVFLNVAGWVLSGAHALNRAGYWIAFATAGFTLVLLRRRFPRIVIAPYRMGKLRRRFRRWLPAAFLALTGLALLGGLLHPPSNYDALAYRIPRILHWLAEGQWHWIHTDFPRLNTRAVGYEWVAAPLLALFQTDRLLFLINGASFLLLPGLCFSLLVRLGISPRVAWPWMWLLPTGYCFLLQAGSIGNDLFGAVFALAAVDFALRATGERRAGDAWFSILAIALLSGAKASNLPLGLPWLVALWPARHLLLRQPVVTAFVTLLAGIASLLPMMLLNVKYCGDWSGQALEHAAFHGLPALRLGVNSLLLTLQNLAPPVFPFASTWNALAQQAIPPAWQSVLAANFEGMASRFGLGEMQVEENAGLGLGICLLASGSLLAGLWLRLRHGLAPASPNRLNRYGAAVILAAVIALLVFMAKSGLSTFARLVTPYYLLLIPLFLCGRGQSVLVRRWGWNAAAMLVFAVAFLLVIVSPARPLWPARAVFQGLSSRGTEHPLIQRAAVVYSVQGQRGRSFDPLLQLLPPTVSRLGVVTFDDPEAALWQPFGARRILHITSRDTPETLRQRGIDHAVLHVEMFQMLFHEPLDDWLSRFAAEVIQEIPLRLRGNREASHWLIVRFSNMDGNPLPSLAPVTP